MNITPAEFPVLIKPRMILIAIIIIVVMAFLMPSFFMVDQTEQGVALGFGQFNCIVGPGLHCKIPFGIEQRYNVPTQVVQTLAFGFRTERPGIMTVYARGDYRQASVIRAGACKSSIRNPDHISKHALQQGVGRGDGLRDPVHRHRGC